MLTDYVIVGSGLTGAVIARHLHDAGRSVLVLERRAHMGGNVHDHVHSSGIRIHTYGPHYFRTSNEEVWQFVNRFSAFYPHAPLVKSLVDGRYENWPVAASYLEEIIGEYWRPPFQGTPGNLEEACLSIMPEVIYDKFVKGYNVKQWGTDPKALLPDLVKRFEIRKDDEPRLKPNHVYQGIPVHGYALFMENMLKDIPVLLNVDYLEQRNSFSHRKLLIYTGPVDEYFGYTLGKLKYRGQVREHKYRKDVDFVQPFGQINNPDINNGPHIRTIEWKHLMPPEDVMKTRGTVTTKEVPFTPENPADFEYPFPDAHNAKLYASYKALTNALPRVLFCGRLGEYKYLDMDEAVEKALVLARQILNHHTHRPGNTFSH